MLGSLCFNRSERTRLLGGVLPVGWRVEIRIPGGEMFVRGLWSYRVLTRRATGLHEKSFDHGSRLGLISGAYGLCILSWAGKEPLKETPLTRFNGPNTL